MLCDAAQIFDGKINGIIYVPVRNKILFEAKTNILES